VKLWLPAASAAGSFVLLSCALFESEFDMGLAIATSHGRQRHDLAHDLRVERVTFAAKVRTARAILGLSQEQFARRIRLTQKSVHRIEQGTVDARLDTVLKIQRFWLQQGIAFEDLRGGGFRLIVGSDVLLRSHDASVAPDPEQSPTVD
jgi:DNA-binding XRE family transcriptional regulator